MEMRAGRRRTTKSAERGRGRQKEKRRGEEISYDFEVERAKAIEY